MNARHGSNPVLPALCWFLLVTLATIASGCGGSNAALRCRSPRAMKYVVTASDRVNLDDEGRALATVVRVYQLKSLARLDNADFEEIWLHGEDTLGEDLVKVEELQLFPTDVATRALDVGEGVNFLVAVALFRKPAGVSWRTVYELPLSKCSSGKAPGDAVARFLLEDYRIETLDEPVRGGTK